MNKITLKQKVSNKISRCWKRNVFTRKDFQGLGGYDQVGRALLQLEREGQLMRIGYGLYCKARVNKINGELMLNGGFIDIAREALDLLGVDWDISEAEKEYNLGLTTQVPANPGVIIKDRFSRQIKTNKFSLFESP